MFRRRCCCALKLIFRAQKAAAHHLLCVWEKESSIWRLAVVIIFIIILSIVDITVHRPSSIWIESNAMRDIFRIMCENWAMCSSSRRKMPTFAKNIVELQTAVSICHAARIFWLTNAFVWTHSFQQQQSCMKHRPPNAASEIEIKHKEAIQLRAIEIFWISWRKKMAQSPLEQSLGAAGVSIVRKLNREKVHFSETKNSVT